MSTYMTFINCDGQHFGQFVVEDEATANSLHLMMERISSWAIDDKGFASCLIAPHKDEEGNTYFELDCTTQQGENLILIAACFKATTQ